MYLIPPIIISFLFGFTAHHIFLKNEEINKHLKLFVVSSLVTGLGISGLLLSIYKLIFENMTLFFILEALLCLICLFYLIKNFRFIKKIKTKLKPDKEFLVIKYLFIMIQTLLLGWFVLSVIKFPGGKWDSFASWNLSAKYFYYSGFSLVRNTYILQPDYPPMLSMMITRLWHYNDSVNQAGPILINSIMSFSLIVIFYLFVSSIKERWTGMISTICLVTSLYFLKFVFSQYADIPLSLFLLLSFIYLFLYEEQSNNHGYFYLIGIEIGSVILMKNEGAVLGILFLIILFFWNRKQQKGSLKFKLKNLFFGILPFLLFYLYFKLFIAPSNELYATMLSSEQITAGIFNFKKYIAFFSFLPYLFLNYIGILFLIGRNIVTGIDKKHINFFYRVLTFILIQLFVIFILYLLNPWSLDNFIFSAADRLVLQIWPVLVLCATIISKDRLRLSNS